MPVISIPVLSLLLVAITVWLCIFLLYLRIEATPHDFHLKYLHAAPKHRVHFEVYQSEVNESKWNTTWN